jgi:hypothetical protein
MVAVLGAVTLGSPPRLPFLCRTLGAREDGVGGIPFDA